MEKRKTRVAVLFGGKSGEHEISLLSAASVMQALDRERYDVVPIGIDKSGRWLIGDDPLRALSEGRAEKLIPAQLMTDPEAHGLTPIAAEILPSARSGAPAAAPGLQTFDVVFPVLHGPFGEDGTIQGLLELADVPYVGCGVAASAVGMDKALMKAVFAAAGLPQVRHLLVLRSEIEAGTAAARVREALPLPVFVKPCNLGSSVGVSKVKSWDALAAALSEAAQYDRRILVEEGVTAREIEISVLGNDDPVASVPGEIVPGAEFYDYADKYVDGKSQLRIPAPLPPAIAVRAFRAIDGCGMARADMFYVESEGRMLVNEVNTIPGFTKISMYPKLWEASGLPYRELIGRLIDLALERHADRARNRTSYAGGTGTGAGAGKG